MFNSKKPNSKAMPDTSNSPVINIISDGTKITGTIVTKDFRIAGELQGSLHVDGKCIISATAVINGDITAMDADIAGKVNGELIIKNKLILRHSSDIYGDIHTKSLLVEEGAKFEGACNMSSRPGESNAKQGINGALVKEPYQLNKVAND